jgi:hypothetical protein
VQGNNGQEQVLEYFGGREYHCFESAIR